MKFRHKPVVIEAEQFILGSNENVKGIEWSDGEPFLYTTEGVLRVSDGDWIITDAMGERSPCKPEIFEMLYDPEPTS